MENKFNWGSFTVGVVLMFAFIMIFPKVFRPSTQNTSTGGQEAAALITNTGGGGGVVSVNGAPGASAQPTAQRVVGTPQVKNCITNVINKTTDKSSLSDAIIANCLK